MSKLTIAQVLVDGSVEAEVSGNDLSTVVSEGQHYFVQYLSDFAAYPMYDTIELKITRGEE